jgi:hypothetical protein
MPIVGFNFDKIGAKKDNKITGKLKVKNDVKITSVEKEKLTITSSEDILKFNFEFKASYEPKFGAIQINGHILYMDDPKKVDDIMKGWKKNKTVPKDLSPIILNAVLSRCSVKALTLSQDVNLPPHIKLPMIRPN